MSKLLGVFLLMVASVLADDFKDLDYNMYTVEELRTTLLCLIDSGPCSELDAMGRKNYPAIVLDACLLCTDDLRHNLRVFIDRVKTELPKEYQDWRNFNDPEGIGYFDKFKSSVAGY